MKRIRILYNDTTITIINDIAEAFNNYFTSVAVNISSEIPHTDIDFRDFLQDYNFTDMFFLPLLTPSEIKEITLGLKWTGGGHLKIPAKMFENVIVLISVPWSNIFNKDMEMSYFPDLIKITRVAYIFESNDPLVIKKLPTNFITFNFQYNVRKTIV